jgi:hypothetical protein
MANIIPFQIGDTVEINDGSASQGFVGTIKEIQHDDAHLVEYSFGKFKCHKYLFSREMILVDSRKKSND